MAMLSSWISKGAEAITNSAKSMAQSTNSSVDTQAIMRQVLNKIQVKLSRQLGESVEPHLSTISSQILQQAQLEKILLETKEKYNNLVSQAQLQNEIVKQMMQSFIEFLKSLCRSLNNEDMMAPLKQLESAFTVCNNSKVDKQLKYFSKLYDAALEDYIKECLNSKAAQHKDEILLFKNLNKNLEVELFRSRNNCSDLEKRLNETSCKSQQLAQKLSIFDKLGAENAILSLNKEKERHSQRQKQLLDKIKSLQLEVLKLQKSLKQAGNEVVKINSTIELIKRNNDAIVQELKRQLSKKQQASQAAISKSYSQKMQQEDQIKLLTKDLKSKEEQITVIKSKLSVPKVQIKSTQVKDLKSRISQLEDEIAKNNQQLASLVSKEMMRVLFMSFEDESKEWSVRKDIKNQIYLLLDIKPKTTEVKVEGKKWLGIF